MLTAVVLLVLGVCQIDGRSVFDQGYTCIIEDETNILQKCTGTGEYLSLENQGITGIQNGAFTGLSNLQQLSLAENAITVIQNRAFTGLSNVNDLGLQNNAITGIQNGAFTSLSKLKELRLAGNPLVCSDTNNDWVDGTAISSVCTSCTAQNGGKPHTVTVDNSDFWQCPTVSPSESPFSTYLIGIIVAVVGVIIVVVVVVCVVRAKGSSNRRQVQEEEEEQPQQQQEAREQQEEEEEEQQQQGGDEWFTTNDPPPSYDAVNSNAAWGLDK